MPQDIRFGDRLAQAVAHKNSAVCVGLDPRWKNLPEAIRSGVDGSSLEAVAGATACYCREVIDAVVTHTAIVKPQAAFFEQLGPAGMAALADVIGYARKVGLLVLLDGKRGDIGSTAEGYADAYLGEHSPWGCDALTVNPYLGDDTLLPFIKVANERSAGIFVLVKTSNPGSGFIQDQVVEGRTIFEKMADFVQASALDTADDSGFGNIGAVVGATYPQQLADLRRAMPNAWILIPGFGAQGGTADDVAHGFNAEGLGAIVNSSRGIIFAYEQERFRAADWQKSVAQAAQEMAEQLNTVRAK